MKSIPCLVIVGLSLTVVLAARASPANEAAPAAQGPWATVCTAAEDARVYGAVTEFPQISVPELGFEFPAGGFPECREEAAPAGFAQAREGNPARARDLWLIRARLLPGFPNAAAPSLLPLGWQWLEIDRHGGR